MPQWNDPVPATDLFQGVRASLGMPSPITSDYLKLLGTACPWCGSGPKTWCVNTVMGTTKREPHEARYLAAGFTPPRKPAYADTAARQVEEARAERLPDVSSPGSPGQTT